MMGIMVESLIGRDMDASAKAEFEAEREKQRREREDAKRVRKERSVLLRAKLITILDERRADAFAQESLR
jgi:hypothetical protein